MLLMDYTYMALFKQYHFSQRDVHWCNCSLYIWLPIHKLCRFKVEIWKISTPYRTVSLSENINDSHLVSIKMFCKYYLN